MILSRLITFILFFFLLFGANSAFCADNYRVKEIITDNSDRMVLISGYDNVKNNAGSIYLSSGVNSVNILNKISISTLTNPNRFILDIPHATLVGASKVYKMNNSSVIDNISMTQVSSTPNIVRVVFTLHKGISPNKFKTYTDGSSILVKYKDAIIDNSIQYKFYTPAGDSDKTANLQNTSSILTYNNSNNTYELNARLQTRYYLSKVNQNSDGLILRGLGAISLQRTYFSPDGSRAEVILDNADSSSKVIDKTYVVPSSQKDLSAELTISKLTAKKLKLTLRGHDLKNYRFVVSPDGQCLFISHRDFVSKTVLSSNLATVQTYKFSKTDAGYNLFEMTFNKPVTYNVFEQNNNFYLDINNLSDYNKELLNQTLKTSGIKVETVKIANDKTRFIIPSDKLNFAYGNIESNAKSIKLCFKEKVITPTVKNEEITIVQNPPAENIAVVEKNNKNENSVSYIPKSEEKTPEIKNPEPKNSVADKLKGKKEIQNHKKRDSDKKIIVLDAGHGGADAGAVGGAIYEKNLNLSIAKLVDKKLTQKGVKVYPTRTKDVTMTLEDRVSYSNGISPDAFISIHTNSIVQEDIFGLEVHYFKDDSLSLAELIHKNFVSDENLTKWETKDRGMIKSRFYVINHTEAPAVLIEVGFISNKTEREKLNTTQRQEQIADSIVAGILEYLGINENNENGSK